MLWASLRLSIISAYTELLSIHSLGRRVDQLLVQNTMIQCFCFQEPRGKGWKKENMFMVDLPGISTIDAVPAAGFITLAQFRCTNLNSVLRVYRPFPLIPLVLPLILPIDFLFPSAPPLLSRL